MTLTDSEYTSRRPGWRTPADTMCTPRWCSDRGSRCRRSTTSGRLPGRVRLIFRARRGVGAGRCGRRHQDGYLNDVDVIFGMHCDPKADIGTLGGRVGPITSASDTVEIVLGGPGGHTARPERTVDLVQVAGRLVTELPARFAELAAPLGATRLVFGALHTGDAPNVIPSVARLRGAVRTPSRELWDAVPEYLRRAIADVLGESGAQWS